MAETPGPSTYRLRWGLEELILEERTPSGEYVERTRPGIGVPPTSLAAIHPELKTLLGETLRKIRHGWLGNDNRLDIALTPPWAFGWLLQIGELDEEEFEEQVVWELQQKVEGDLEDYIYAWQPIKDDAYAITVRPQLLAFWQEIAAQFGISLGKITVQTNLVSADIEESADLLTLYRLWRQKQGLPLDEPSVKRFDLEEAFEESTPQAPAPEPAFQDPFSSPTILDDETSDADSFSLDDFASGGRSSARQDEDDSFGDLLSDDYSEQKSYDDDDEYRYEDDDDEYDFGYGKKKKKKFSPLTVIMILVIIGAAYFVGKGIYFRVQASRSSVPDSTAMAEELAVTPPTVEYIVSLYDFADSVNVQLPSLILHGDVVRCELNADSAGVTNWVQLCASVPGASGWEIIPPQRSGETNLVQFSIAARDSEESITMIQFSDLAAVFGLETPTETIFHANRSQLSQLLMGLAAGNSRPFRLSIHSDGADGYNLVVRP